MSDSKRNVTSIKSSLKSMARSSNLSVIIPAAGMGHRMKSYGPKALIKINSRTTLIERQIKIIWKNYPDCEIFVVVGFDSDKIKKSLSRYPVRFIENPIHEKTNVLYSIGIATQATITDKILIVYGDLVFNEHAIKGIVGDESKIVVDNNGHMDKREVGLVCEKNEIKNFSFGLEKKWSQIAYLRGKELSLFKDVCCSKDTSQWFGYEALNRVIENEGNLFGFSNKKMKIVEIDIAKDLNKLKLLS